MGVEQNRDVNFFSDEFINGNTVVGYGAGSSEYDYNGGLLIVVEQQQITEDAYNYTEVVKSVTAANGGLNPVLPATLDGNINSLTEGGNLVLGYFAAVASSEKCQDFFAILLEALRYPFNSTTTIFPRRQILSTPTPAKARTVPPFARKAGRSKSRLLS